MNITIAGGSGFLGIALTNFFLNKGEQVTILSRTKPKIAGTTHIPWIDEANVKNALVDADVVINLAGKSVNCRYTAANKKAILDSRTQTTQQIGRVISDIGKPKIWINSSTATIYSDSRDKPMTEASGEIIQDFSASVAMAWEDAFFKFKNHNIRQVAMRTSIVLGNEGGAYVPLKTLVKLGLGGAQGDGNQMVSWIHITDFCQAVWFIIQTKEIEGIINVTSPKPIKNKDFMQHMKNEYCIGMGINQPEWLLAAGAVMIGTEIELILKSRWVIPEKLEKAGFDWKYGDIASAIHHLAHG
jgi:uncharacterized protein (TIGR01777 family)